MFRIDQKAYHLQNHSDLLLILKQFAHYLQHLILSQFLVDLYSNKGFSQSLQIHLVRCF